MYSACFVIFIFFFFNDTATTEIYTLSLHDALPIYSPQGDKGRLRDARGIHGGGGRRGARRRAAGGRAQAQGVPEDRKSTRLNSSHANISYAVFCLKKKNKN